MSRFFHSLIPISLMCNSPNSLCALWEGVGQKRSHPGTFTSSQRMKNWNMIQKCTYVNCTYYEAFVTHASALSPEGIDSSGVHFSVPLLPEEQLYYILYTLAKPTHLLPK